MFKKYIFTIMLTLGLAYATEQANSVEISKHDYKATHKDHGTFGHPKHPEKARQSKGKSKSSQSKSETKPLQRK